jgi:hypothetical protein
MRVLDILEMNTAEFAGWVAFYKWEAEESKKAMQKAKTRTR